MISPKPQTLTTLPRDSMVHYASYDKQHLDVDTSKLIYNTGSRKILIDFPEQLTSTLGAPRLYPTVLRNKFNPFLKKNRKFRYMKNGYAQVDDALTLFVENYSYLYELYRYIDLPMNTYNEWFNISRTMLDNMVKVSKAVGKNHFVFVDVPHELPSMGLLNMYADNNNVSMLKVFDNPSKLFILNMFRWIGTIVTPVDKKQQEDLTLEDPALLVTKNDNIFSNIPSDKLSNINIAFTTRDGRCVVLNMGYLKSWVKGQKNRTELSTVDQVSNEQLQRVFVKFLISLQSYIDEEIIAPVQPSGDPVDIDEDEELIAAQDEYDQEHDLDIGDNVDDHEYEDALSHARRLTSKTVDPVRLSPVKLDNRSIDEAINDTVTLDEQLKEIDKDLLILEEVTVRKLKDKGIQVGKDGEVQSQATVSEDIPLHEIQRKVFVSEDTEVSLRRQLDTQVDYGLLSASDYRNFIRDIENFKESKDPYGSGLKFQDAMRVTPELLQLNDEKTKIVSTDLVQDKSMLQSSLLSFDQDYIGKVLHKDMLSMIFGIQKAGIVIRKHDITIEHSALGSYESHALEFKPVDGQISTVRFKVPVISEDGTFVANGNKYVMRKQRVDLNV